MSSMRNAVQRRNHKERAQPKQREKWGLLEKHKDYSLRAKDFKEKKRRLKLLRQKAAERNPDEFHFAMMSSRTDDRGVKIADRGNQLLSVETVALLKTQDAGYLRTVLQKTRKAIERLEQVLTFNKTEVGDFVLRSADEDEYEDSGRIAFVESVEEQEAWTSHRTAASKALADAMQADPSSHDMDANLDEDELEATPQPTKKSLRKVEEETKSARLNQKRRRRNQEIRQTTLDILRKREKNLRAAEVALEAQRSRMNNGHGINVTKKGVTFKNRARKK